MMKRLLVLAVVSAAGTALADDGVVLYTPNGLLVVHMSDESGDLAKLVGDGKRGPMRCYAEADGVVGLHDQPMIGCFVAIKRDGSLVAPPMLSTSPKRIETYHFSGISDGALQIQPGAKPDTLALSISGNAGSLIGLWVDCLGKPRDLKCEGDHGMAGRFNWTIELVVTKGGGVKRPS